MPAANRTEELNRISVDFLAAFNRGDVDAIMSFFTEDAIYDEMHGKKNIGKAAIRKSFEKLFSGKFGEIRFDEKDTFIEASENKVMSSWILNIEIDGVPKAMHGLDLLHFDGDLVTFKGTYVKAVQGLYQDK